MLGIHSIYRQDVPGEIHALRIIFSGEANGDVSLEHGELMDGAAEIADYKWLTPEEVLAMDDKLFRYQDIKELSSSESGKGYIPEYEIILDIIL